MQQIGGFANVTPHTHQSKEERPGSGGAYPAVTGKPEAITGLAAHGEELFVASEPVDFRGYPLRPRINVFSRDGTFLRHLELQSFWPTGVLVDGPDGKLAPRVLEPQEHHECPHGRGRPHDPCGIFAAQSAEYGPLLVTIRGIQQDRCPWTRHVHVCTHAIDGRALHAIRFASVPQDVTAHGRRVYVCTREALPDNVYAYELPAAERVNGARVVDVKF